MSNNRCKGPNILEQTALNEAQRRYNSAVDNVKRYPNSSKVYEAEEKRVFANLMLMNAKYGK